MAKALSPKVTIVMPSHLKPLVAEAIDSVLAQTLTDWNLVIYDAGHWLENEFSPMHEVYAEYKDKDPRIEWIITGDDVDFRKRYCPVSYRFNQAMREGKVLGEYCILMPDDDIIYPEYLEKMYYFAKENKRDAVYCQQDWVNLWKGKEIPRGGMYPTKAFYGECISHLDLLMVMWSKKCLETMEKPYFIEDPEDHICRVQDGLFFDKLCKVADGIHPVGEVLCMHRFNEMATYSPI